MAKDCLDGIRDPLWLDMVPLHSLGMGIQSLPNVAPTSKNRVAVVALVLEVCYMRIETAFMLCNSLCMQLNMFGILIKCGLVNALCSNSAILR